MVKVRLFLGKGCPHSGLGVDGVISQATTSLLSLYPDHGHNLFVDAIMPVRDHCVN